jgi:hypothetical protein
MAIDDFGFPIITEKATKEKTQLVDDFGFPIITEEATEEKTQSVDDFGFPIITEEIGLKEKEKGSSWARRAIADPLLALGKGVTQLPDVVSGLADTVISPLSGGKLSVGKGFEWIEEQLPDALQDVGDTLEAAKSPELLANREAQRKEIDAAEGFIDTTKTTIGTLLKSPSLLFDTLFESLPSTVSGGVIGKGLLKAKSLSGAGLTPLGAGAAGEGLVSGGSTAESIRQQTEDGVLSAKQSGIAVGSGILTGIFGKLGGSLSKKFDVIDIDTYLAGGFAAQTAEKKIIDAFTSAIIESTAEELPQSIQEQIAQNIALNKDPMEGVGEAAGTGFLLGFTMGGGASLLLESADTTTTKKPLPNAEPKIEYTEDESLNTDPSIFGIIPEKKLNVEDTITDTQLDMYPKKIEEYAKIIEKPSYLTRKKAEDRLAELQNEDVGRYRGIATNIFKVVEIPQGIDKKTGERTSIFKLARIDKDSGGGGTGDEQDLTLEQEKERYEQSKSNIPEEFAGPGINERLDTTGNRTSNVVPGELNNANTDTKTAEKSTGKGLDSGTNTTGKPNGTKVDSSSTLEFINKTDKKSPLRNPAISKVLTDNPKILETATETETIISNTGLNPTQYKKEYAKWSSVQKKDKVSWERRQNNQEQLTKDFEASITPNQKNINSQLAEGLAPLKTETKVLDTAIREVVAEEYAGSSRTKRSNLLRKYRRPKEIQLEKEYQRINKKYKKENKGVGDIGRVEAAHQANNEQLKKRTVSDKGKVSYFSDAKPQEFIEDAAIIEDINRKSLGLDKYRNFRKALENVGKLDQYNKEVNNIIANPPSSKGILMFDKENFVGAFNTAEARDKRLEDLNNNKVEDRPRIDGRIFVAYDAAGSATKDQKGKYKIRNIVDENFESEITEDTKQDKLIQDVSVTEEETIEDTSVAGDLKKEIDSTQTAEDVFKYKKDSGITDGTDLAQQDINVKIGNIQKVLTETIGKKGTSVSAVLEVLSDYQGPQATLQSSKIAEIFNQILKTKELASVFKDIKVVMDNNLKDKGQYNPNTQTITINLERINQDKVQDVGPVVIHEITHALLDSVLLAKNFNKLNASMQEAVMEIKNQYKQFQRLKKLQPNKIFNRAKNLKEFVAMMFESSELARAIAESAAQQQIDRETAIFKQGLGKQDKTEDEFTDYIDSITGTRPIKSTLENVAKTITNFFKEVMSALGLGRVGANRIVQDVIQNSIKIILDKDFAATYGSLTPGALSNFGDNNTKKANKLLLEETEQKLRDAPSKKSYFDSRSIFEKSGDAIQSIQDVHAKLKTFVKKLEDGGQLTVDNDINTQQTLIQGRADRKFKQALLPFQSNMFLAYENFQSVMGSSVKPRILEKMVNDLYEAMGEWSRNRWLFLINMPLSNSVDDNFTIPKWKDETGKIGPWTGTPFEFREAILNRMSAAQEAEAKGQSNTNETDKLRAMFEIFIDSQQQKAFAMFKKGTDSVGWHLPNPNRTTPSSYTSARREAFDPMNLSYSSGTLGVNIKDTAKNVSSQEEAKKLLAKLGLNYDANLTPMNEQQLKDNAGTVLDQAKRDGFLQLAERIQEANNANKEVNKENGYVPPQANNIINFMGFKYYKSLKRKKDVEDKSLHEVRDKKFMEGDQASGEYNQGIEEKFSGGQQEAVNNVISQTAADAIQAATRFGYQTYTQAIANLSQDTLSIVTEDGKTVEQPKADFLKFVKTYSYDDRYKLSEKLKNDKDKDRIILNFKNNGEIDVIKITREDMVIPLKGNVTEVNKIIRTLAKATSIVGQIHTRFSVPFGLTNFQRDFFTNIPLLIIQNPSAAIPYIGNILGQVFKGNFATTWRYVRAMNRGDIDYIEQRLTKPESYKKSQAEYEKTYDYAIASYLWEGGMIAYLRGVSNNSQSELLTKEIRKNKRILNTVVINRVFDAWINTFEIAVRASAAKAVKPALFKKALKQAGNPKPGTEEYKKIKKGMEEKAASTVKNFSNFEQAGTDSAKISAFYMFFKPSMTSAVVNIRAIAPAFTSDSAYLATQDPKLLQNPEYKAQALETFQGERRRALSVVLGSGGLGYALWFMLASVGDEDEQKKFKQDDMERWVRNIRIPLTWLPEEVKQSLGIKKDTGDNMIQMHWGFGNMGWPAIGVQIASFVDGKFGTENNPRLPTDFEFQDLFSNLTNIAMDNFLPLPVSRSKLTKDPLFFFMDSVVPSVFKPIYEYTSNKNTFGYNVTRNRDSVVGGAYGGSMSTEQIYKDLAQFINQRTRFNNEGAVQIDPNVLQFAATSYLDGFARIVSALASSGKITDLESAKNQTLVFKQFITKQVPVERSRYARMTEKLKNIDMTNTQFLLDVTYVDAKGRGYEEFMVQNFKNLEMLRMYKETEKTLKEIYEQQKEFQIGIDSSGEKYNEFYVKDQLENFKINILATMRQLTDRLVREDEDNIEPLFK